MLADQGEDLRRVSGLADDFEARACQQARHPLAEKHVVVRHCYTYPVLVHDHRPFGVSFPPGPSLKEWSL
ncbi:hypothetical protein GCM10009525_59600 [Streptosporangium amethystogenes subsp. fukuiense]